LIFPTRPDMVIWEARYIYTVWNSRTWTNLTFVTIWIHLTSHCL